MVSLHTIAIAGIVLLSPFLDSSDDSGKSAYNNYCRYLFIFCFLDYDLDAQNIMVNLHTVALASIYVYLQLLQSSLQPMAIRNGKLQ